MSIKQVVMALINENDAEANKALHDYLVTKVQSLINEETASQDVYIAAHTRGADDDGDVVEGPFLAIHIKNATAEQISRIQSTDEDEFEDAIVDLKYNDVDSEVDIDQAGGVKVYIGDEFSKVSKLVDQVITKSFAWLERHSNLK